MVPEYQTRIIHDGEMWMWEATRKWFHVTTPISTGKADTKRKATRRMNKHIKEAKANANNGDLS
jgi:hypothetical protein